MLQLQSVDKQFLRKEIKNNKSNPHRYRKDSDVEEMLTWNNYRILLWILACLLPLVLVYSYLVYTIALVVLCICYRVVRIKGRKWSSATGKAVLITGCDTGFGFHLSKRLDDHGFTVFAGVLNMDSCGAETLRGRKSESLYVLKLDVTNEEDVTKAVMLIRQQDKGLWGVVNNAGMNIPGNIEHTTIEQFKRLADINLYGMLRVIKATLPFIRQSKGRIVNISSVKGRYAWPNHANYHITKYGVETMTDCLRLEIKQFGVSVSVVEPGHYDGATSASSPEMQKWRKSEADKQWEEATEEVRQTYGKGYFYRFLQRNAIDGAAHSPNPVLDAIDDALLNESPQPRYLVPGGSGKVDKYAEFGRFYGFLPECISDVILLWFSGYNKRSPSPIEMINSKNGEF